MISIREIHGTLRNGLLVNADSYSMLNNQINEDELYLLDWYIKRYKRFSDVTVVFPISKKYHIDFIGSEQYKDVLICENK